MQLVHVGARTDSTMLTAKMQGMANFCTCVLVYYTVHTEGFVLFISHPLGFHTTTFECSSFMKMTFLKSNHYSKKPISITILLSIVHSCRNRGNGPTGILTYK